MKVDLTDRHHQDLPDLLSIVAEHVASNVPGLIDRICRFGGRDGCQCVTPLSIEAEWGQGIYMTFLGCKGEERVLVQPPPPGYDRRKEVKP